MTSPKSTLVQISAWTTVLTNDHVRGENVRNGAGGVDADDEGLLRDMIGMG